MRHDPNAPLLSELRWFNSQRWLAGLVVLTASGLNLFWTHWVTNEILILSIGVFILFYNLICWLTLKFYSSWLELHHAQRMFAWVQIALDLFCLTALTGLSNGLYSPVLGLFMLHMIFASLLLQSPRNMPYAAWFMAVLMMGCSLWLRGQWPESASESLIGVGWMTTLFLTIYFTTHITRSLQDNRDRTHAVLNAAADGVLTVSRDGRIELANPAFMLMFGSRSAQIVGKQFEQFVPFIKLIEDDTNNSTSKLGPASVESHIGYGLRSDGEEFPIEVSISSMNEGSKKIFIAVVRDVTERQRNEAQLSKLNRELEDHHDRLIQHEKMVSVGRMAAGVAHEIANPLANIDGLIQLVERKPSRLQEETPAQLREQVRRITQIVRQLKEFAHPTESELQSVSVDDLVQSAIDVIRFDRRHRQVAVEKKLVNPCCYILVHPLAIQQVLVNLIVNALDAAKDESGHKVSITSKCMDECFCKISIEDNGTGISEEHLDQIFEPFYTTKSLGQGTGLGLSISYNLVQRNSGRIEVNSKVDVGTTISITFPVAQCPC